MKQTLLIITALMLVVGCSGPVNENTLIEKSGLMYLPNSDKPYSGEAFTFDDGDKEEGAYKDGKREGWWFVTDEGDELAYMKKEYKNGKLDMVIPLQ
jgi:uncharacterized protein YxeA|tara:strand:+ start:165 stop:455 length:291 start_codon:yes stop_codon:yes gene_type:complete